MPIFLMRYLARDKLIHQVNFLIELRFIIAFWDLRHNYSLVFPFTRHIINQLAEFFLAQFKGLALDIDSASSHYSNVSCRNIAYPGVNLTGRPAWVNEASGVELLVIDQGRHATDKRATHDGDCRGFRGRPATARLLSVDGRRWIVRRGVASAVNWFAVLTVGTKTLVALVIPSVGPGLSDARSLIVSISLVRA